MLLMYRRYILHFLILLRICVAAAFMHSHATDATEFTCHQYKVQNIKFHDSFINTQREIIVLNRQGTHQQKPEYPMVTPPGRRVNVRYISSTKGTSFGGVIVYKPTFINSHAAGFTLPDLSTPLWKQLLNLATPLILKHPQNTTCWFLWWK